MEGAENTAVGYQALFSNTTISGNSGGFNTANGSQALYSNTTGFFNTAIGGGALYSNTTANDNTAAGSGALFFNVTGTGNTGIGRQALLVSVGDANTALGAFALSGLSKGGGNIGVGKNAGSLLTTGDDNIYIGSQVGTNVESNNIRIGVQGTQAATFIAGISGTAVAGTAVVVNGSGQLGVTPSSKRFKDNIETMDEASDALFALKPVRFRYKKEIDPTGAPQLGLVAEDVEKVNPDLIVRDKEGKIYSVRYDQVNAMLLNEFLKEHKAFVEEQKKVRKLEAALATVNERLKEQDAKIEKVAAGIATNITAPQVARVP
jgi:hypothetical protein